MIMVREDLNLFEVWKPVPGFPDYEVSSEGRIWSKKNGYLKTRLESRGYEIVNLYLYGKMYTKKVHRLVALAFIQNPDNLPQINHKDENKSNNRIDNLEWCDSKYNLNYGTRIKRQIETKINKGLYNPETVGLSTIDWQRKYREINRERLSTYQKNWKIEHSDYVKKYNSEYYQNKKKSV